MKNLIATIEALPNKPPKIIAIAGPPASGKSMLAEQLLSHFGEDAALLSMDGFHLDNTVLLQKDLYKRKGAPETFDAAGFLATIERIAKRECVYAPIFDRSKDIAIAGAIEIYQQSLIIVEGNYLLCKQHPWQQLLPYWDVVAFIHLPLEVIKQRCIERWLHYGLSKAAAEKRTVENDLVNAEFVLKNRLSHAMLYEIHP